MQRLIFITHPEVVIDPNRAVKDWKLSELGKQRARTFANSPVLDCVTQIWCSTERKALDTAAIFARTLDVNVHTHADLGENDRSSTGFLPPDQFEAAADAFFSLPETSFRGWETAQKAQARIVGAVTQIVQSSETGDIAIVSHGAVGTLLLCHLTRKPIDRSFDQPSQGHYWIANRQTLDVVCGWTSIT